MHGVHLEPVSDVRGGLSDGSEQRCWEWAALVILCILSLLRVWLSFAPQPRTVLRTHAVLPLLDITGWHLSSRTQDCQFLPFCGDKRYDSAHENDWMGRSFKSMWLVRIRGISYISWRIIFFLFLFLLRLPHTTNSSPPPPHTYVRLKVSRCSLRETYKHSSLLAAGVCCNSNGKQVHIIHSLQWGLILWISVWMPCPLPTTITTTTTTTPPPPSPPPPRSKRRSASLRLC